MCVLIVKLLVSPNNFSTVDLKKNIIDKKYFYLFIFLNFVIHTRFFLRCIFELNYFDLSQY